MKKTSWKSPYVSRLTWPALDHHRIGAVSFFNSRPLLEGLEQVPQIDVARRVPSELRTLLEGRQVEAALLPTIDLQQSHLDLTVLPAGCIASSGTVLTVRVFSHVAAEKIRTVWADTDSHTSVALAQVLWHFLFKTELRVVPFTPGHSDVCEDAQAALMIGDKVVTAPPIGYDYQFDLGRMWFEMTGLPFVYAVWAARADSDHEQLYRVLSAARRDGEENLHELAQKYGPVYGWPEDMATRYYTRNLEFDFTDAHREGLEEFFALAEEAGVIEMTRPVEIYNG